MSSESVREMYKQLETPQGASILPCPCCGSEAHVWQYSESETSPTTKAVMCDNGDIIGPQDGIVGAGCLLYMPSDGFYRPTIREAVKYWNDYTNALMKMQRQNRWKTASVLRNGTEDQP